MKLDQLQYFVETARRQHIGQAATYLNISPSAISHSIAALEEEFGKVLFEKQGRQIKLTHNGKLLLDRAEFILSEVVRIQEDLSTGQTIQRGHYRIAATHLIASEFLTPAWFEIQSKHSSLTGTLHSMKSGEVISKVVSGEIDLGFCFSPHSGTNHEQELIHTGQLVLSFGKKHPFLKDKKIEELSRFPCTSALAAQGIDNCENHPIFRKLKITQKITNLFDSYDIAIEALKSNTTWTLLPDFLAYKHRNEIETYIPKNWEAEYKLAAVWPKYRIRTSALDQTTQLVSENIKRAAKQFHK